MRVPNRESFWPLLSALRPRKLSVAKHFGLNKATQIWQRVTRQAVMRDRFPVWNENPELLDHGECAAGSY